MRGVIVHGILLVVMLAFGYQTWTRDKTIRVNTGDVSLWDGSPGDLVAVELESTKPDPVTPSKSSERTVRIERRTEAGGSYWWGSETKTDQKPKKAAASSAGSGSDATDDTVAATSKREFPVGDSVRVTGAPNPMPIDELIGNYASMRAVRQLDKLTDDQKKEYELVDGNTTLAVIFKGKTHTLILGGKVSGNSSRYALDPDSGKAYILAGALIEPLETGESILRPATIHGFAPEALQSVTIAAGGKTKTAVRIAGSDEHGTAVKTWADEPNGKANQTLAIFVDNLDHLVPDKFEPSLKASDMTPVMVATYDDAGGKKIGVLGLYKVERAGDMPEDGSADPTNPPAPAIEYYVITEATRVPGLVSKAQAERAEQDLPGAFASAAAAPSAPAPGTPPAPGAPAPAPTAPGAPAPTPVPAPAPH